MIDGEREGVVDCALSVSSVFAVDAREDRLALDPVPMLLLLVLQLQWKDGRSQLELNPHLCY